MGRDKSSGLLSEAGPPKANERKNSKIQKKKAERKTPKQHIVCDEICTPQSCDENTVTGF